MLGDASSFIVKLEARFEMIFEKKRRIKMRVHEMTEENFGILDSDIQDIRNGKVEVRDLVDAGTHFFLSDFLDEREASEYLGVEKRNLMELLEERIMEILV